jgi:hypothetical protein
MICADDNYLAIISALLLPHGSSQVKNKFARASFLTFGHSSRAVLHTWHKTWQNYAICTRVIYYANIIFFRGTFNL